MKQAIKQYIPKDYSTLLQWVMYFWAGSICFPALQGSFYGVFALLLWGVLKGHIGFSFLPPKGIDGKRSPLGGFRGLPFYFLLAYLLWMTATIFWSDDIREYFRQFEKLIPLYLLAFIGFMEGIDKHIDFNKVLNAFLWGVLIAIGYMVVRMGVDMFVGDTIGRIKTAGIMSLDLLSYVNHRTYIGLTLFTSIPYLLIRVKRMSIGHQGLFFSIVLFIDLLCIMSGARTLMFFSIIITLYSIYYLWFKNHYIFIILSIAIVASGLIGVSYNKRITLNFTQIKQGIDLTEVESRIILWKTAFELIKESPIVGYGLGDTEQVLIADYLKTGNKIVASKKLNSHNQYLQTTLMGGLVALFFILSFFILLVYYTKTSFVLKLFAIIFIGFCLFIESMLVRNIGSMFFVFFIFLFIYSNAEGQENIALKAKLIACYIFIFIFITSLVIAKKRKIDNTEPRTYMVGDFSKIEWNNVPFNRYLPAKTAAALCDLNQLNLKQYIDCDYFNDDFYVVDLSEMNKSDIHFSFWCFIPDSADIKSIGISIFDGDNQATSTYNLGEINTWQKLEIQKTSGFGRTRLYFMLTTRKEREHVNNFVYFALPRVIINSDTIY